MKKVIKKAFNIINLHSLDRDDSADIAAIEERLRKLRGETAPPPTVEDLAARFKKIAGYDLMTAGESTPTGLGSVAAADIAADNFLNQVAQSGPVLPSPDSVGLANEARAAILSVCVVTIHPLRDSLA